MTNLKEVPAVSYAEQIMRNYCVKVRAAEMEALEKRIRQGCNRCGVSLVDGDKLAAGAVILEHASSKYGTMEVYREPVCWVCSTKIPGALPAGTSGAAYFVPHVPNNREIMEEVRRMRDEGPIVLPRVVPTIEQIDFLAMPLPEVVALRDRLNEIIYDRQKASPGRD